MYMFIQYIYYVLLTRSVQVEQEIRLKLESCTIYLYDVLFYTIVL